MLVSGVVRGLAFDQFEVKAGVKQGYVLAPTLFNIYLAVGDLLSRYNLHLEDGIVFRYHLDGSFFNFQWQKGTTMGRTATAFHLRYVDDAAFISLAAGLQRSLSTMSNNYTNTGLMINARKTDFFLVPLMMIFTPLPSGSELKTSSRSVPSSI